MSEQHSSYQLYIDGKWTGADSDRSIEVIDPATEELIGVVPEASPADARRAIEAARRAFDDGPWPRLSVRERAAIIERFAEILDAERERLVDLTISEAGCTRMLADLIQVGKALEAVHFCAEMVSHLEWERPLPPDIGPLGIANSIVVREPVGVVSAITPFNFPLFLSLWKVAPALVTGNTVVLKPHPWTPLHAFEIARAAEEAGIPPGVLNVVTGHAEVGEELASNPMVDMVTFTGSTATGRRILELAATTVKRVQLELGGKSATIVLDDASEEQIAQIGVSGCVVHAGQACAAQTRLLIPERHLEIYKQGARAMAPLLKLGDPRDPATVVGPLIREQQRLRVEDYVASGLEQGAELLVGGERPSEPQKGFFYPPTVFVGCTNDMKICQEEIFGPVLAVLSYESEEEAIQIANDSIYGLAGGVISSSRTHALAVARRIRAGHVSIGGQGGTGLNYHGIWGGYKQSGLGREWGRYGLEECTELKQINWGSE